MANIRDVAQLAGCSTTTVSRYVNHKHVSRRLEQRILNAIDTLAYSPSNVARSLKLKRSMLLAMTIPDITEPFFPAVVKGVDDVARAAGYSLMLFNTGEDEEREARCVDLIVAHGCDGALLIETPAGPSHVAYRERLARLPLPIVCVNRAPSIERDAVLVDNRTGACRGVEHLLKLGHRRIAIVMMAHKVSTYEERLDGYRDALAVHGVDWREEYVQRIEVTVSDAYSATLALLALPSPPTAIFATSARLTVGVMAAINSRGLACPADVSVLGHDSFEWQEEFHPRLTIIAQPGYEMGSRAADLLVQRISGQLQGASQRIMLQSNLVVRESCGVYPRAPARVAVLQGST